MVVKEKVGLGLNADFPNDYAKKQSFWTKELMQRGRFFYKVC